MTNYNPDTYCSLAFTGYDARAKSVCCWTAKTLGGVNSFLELRDSPAIHNLQQDLLAGVKNAICQDCWKQEEVGQTSMRQSHSLNKSDLTIKKEIQNKKLKYLVIDSGNVCNLACRTCNPWSSSAWFKEYNEKNSKKFNFAVKQTDTAYLINEEFQELEWLSVLGGEPFQNLDHLQVLEVIVQQGYAKNCTLGYVTNGTVKMSDKIKDISEHFKLIRLTLSIDATEKQFEYIRTNGDWNQLVNNIADFSSIKNIVLGAHPTISALNIFYLDELFQWFTNLSISYSLVFCERPTYYSFNIFNDKQKIELIEHLKKSKFDVATIINHINHSVFDQSALEQFWLEIESTKKLKGLDAEVYIPKLLDFLK